MIIQALKSIQKILRPDFHYTHEITFNLIESLIKSYPTNPHSSFNQSWLKQVFNRLLYIYNIFNLKVAALIRELLQKILSQIDESFQPELFDISEFSDYQAAAFESVSLFPMGWHKYKSLPYEDRYYIYAYVTRYQLRLSFPGIIDWLKNVPFLKARLPLFQWHQLNIFFQ